MRDHRRQGRAGRIVDRRIGDVEPRPVLGQRAAELREVRPDRRVGHADDPGAVGAQQGLEIEVAGIVDQHDIAGLNQQPAQQVHRLRPGLGQHDLVRRGLDAALGHAAGNELAQRRQAQWGAVVGQAPGRRRARACAAPSLCRPPAAMMVEAIRNRASGRHRRLPAIAATPRTDRRRGPALGRPPRARAAPSGWRHRIPSPAGSGWRPRRPAVHRPPPPSRPTP